MGIMSACTSLFGLLMVFEKKTNLDELETNEESESIQTNTNDEDSKPLLSLSKALTTKNVWLLASIYCFNCIPSDIFSINYKVSLKVIFKLNFILLKNSIHEELWSNLYKR